MDDLCSESHWEGKRLASIFNSSSLKISNSEMSLKVMLRTFLEKA